MCVISFISFILFLAHLSHFHSLSFYLVCVYVCLEINEKKEEEIIYIMYKKNEFSFSLSLFCILFFSLCGDVLGQKIHDNDFGYLWIKFIFSNLNKLTGCFKSSSLRSWCILWRTTVPNWIFEWKRNSKKINFKNYHFPNNA